jgi:uncharacterized OsmC-like protein
MSTEPAPASVTPDEPRPPGPSVRAEFIDRRGIIFTARGRMFMNVREAVADGPIGFSSTELLLIAIGNCSLGTLFNHPLLKDARVSDIRAELHATMASEPPRVARIETVITAKVADPELLKHTAELEAITCACPMCNSLSSEKTLTVRFRTA